MLSSNQLFWLLQFSGWFGFALLTYLSITVMLDQHGPYVFHPFVQSLVGIVISWPLRFIYRFVWEWGTLLRLLVIVVSVTLFSLLWTLIRLDLFLRMTGEEIDYIEELSIWFFTGVLVFLGWTALYHGFRYYRLLQEEHEALLRTEQEKQAESLRRENAERLAQETRLKMLRYQLNPHFLFNTMNAIVSLINSGRNAAAIKMVNSLSDFLRSTLQDDPLRRVTLREEFLSLKNYLSIEKTRFGHRLVIDMKMEGAAPEFLVPSLLLQPLAENVVKHAVRPAVKPVTLTVSARQEGDDLEITVSDTGPGIAKMDAGTELGEGIGLRNVRDRLTNIYGEAHQLRLESQAEGGLRVVIRIPAQRREATVPEGRRATGHV